MSSKGQPVLDTIWVSESVSPEIKILISSFFELADSKDPEAGRQLATSVFAKDAVFVSASGTFQGYQEISKCRDGAWNLVESRQHRVQKAFFSTTDGLELCLLASVKIEFKNGNLIESPFACHVQLEMTGSEEGSLRIRYLQVFADTAPLRAAAAS
ncbi:uncharacterized protein FRV6_08411 [Fusarium oxysporum]|uniref:SnoaL-like domain-containing protein n=1 Tax=Fusarium oxysporum TaxID=5507 RepID=A0A2H3T6D9_FUSOX|nr:uncharacterized protein FRV6_08411 [Fusarium oxysporum]